MMPIRLGLWGYSLCSMTLGYRPVRNFRSLCRMTKADNVKTSIEFMPMIVNIEKNETLESIYLIKCGSRAS